MKFSEESPLRKSVQTYVSGRFFSILSLFVRTKLYPRLTELPNSQDLIKAVDSAILWVTPLLLKGRLEKDEKIRLYAIMAQLSEDIARFGLSRRDNIDDTRFDNTRLQKLLQPVQQNLDRNSGNNGRYSSDK